MLRNRESHVSLGIVLLLLLWLGHVFGARFCALGEGRTAGLHGLSLKKRHFFVIGFFFSCFLLSV